MPTPVVSKLNDKSIIVKQKYFDISILTIPVLALLLPNQMEKIIFGFFLLILLIIAFLFVTKETLIIKGSPVIVEYSIVVLGISIKEYRHVIDRQFFNVLVEQFISGGTSENTGIESYTIHLRDNMKTAARITGYKNLQLAEEVAQQIRL